MSTKVLKKNIYRITQMFNSLELFFRICYTDPVNRTVHRT